MMSPRTPSPNDNQRLLPLDGLRGIAISLVLMVHSFKYSGENILGKGLDNFARAGWVGVTLFFVLSGFLISGILLDTVGRTNYLRDFFVRRSLRIFPIYFAFLAFYFLVVPRVPTLSAILPQPSKIDQIVYLTYTTNMYESLASPGSKQVETLAPLWSLAVEEQVYLVWPFIFLLIPRPRLHAFFIAIASFSILWRIGTRLTSQPIELTYCWTPANLEAFAAGAIVAILLRERFELLQTQAPRVAMAAFCFIVGMWVGQRHFNFWAGPMQVLTVGTTAVIVFCSSLIGVLVTRTKRSVINEILSNAALRSLGKYSYAIYLFHSPLIALLRHHFYVEMNGFHHDSVLHSILFTSLVAASSILAALISWHTIEKWFLGLKAYFPLSGQVHNFATPNPNQI